VGPLLSELIVLPVIAQSVRTLPQLKFGVRLLLGTLAGVAVIQFINYAGASHGIVIGEVQGAERGEWRYFGPVGDSVGVVLLLGYLAALCYGNPIAIALFLGGIVLTAGVGAIVATAFGTGLFLLLGTRTATVRAATRRHAWLLPLIVLGAVLSLAGFAQPMAKTFLKRFSSGSYASSGTQRSASLRMAGRMIVDNPVLGVGYMGYERALEKYGGEEYFDLAHPDGATANANNQIAQSLADAGVLGLVALLGVVFAAGRLLLRVARCEDQFVSTFFLAAFLWLLAQLLGNLAAVWLNPSAFVARLLWVTLGLAVAARRILRVTGPQPATHKTEPFATPLLPA
jgi:O-antigen ligase